MFVKINHYFIYKSQIIKKNKWPKLRPKGSTPSKILHAGKLMLYMGAH